MDGTPLVFQLTAEMIELEERGSSHHKEGGGLNPVPTLESEKFSEVGSRLILFINPHAVTHLGISVFCSFVPDLNFLQDESKLYQMLLNVRMKLAQDIGTAP